jgi:hypothetical protein
MALRVAPPLEAEQSLLASGLGCLSSFVVISAMFALNAPTVGSYSMLLDSLMPEFDATRIEHRVIDGRPADVYEVAIHVDSLDAMRRSPIVRGLFALRAAAASGRDRPAISGGEPARAWRVASRRDARARRLASLHVGGCCRGESTVSALAPLRASLDIAWGEDPV